MPDQIDVWLPELYRPHQWKLDGVLVEWASLPDPPAAAISAASLLDGHFGAWKPYGRPTVRVSIARQLGRPALEPQVEAALAASAKGSALGTPTGQISNAATPILAGLAVVGTAWTTEGSAARAFRQLLERAGLPRP
jgi:hypothetical protein